MFLCYSMYLCVFLCTVCFVSFCIPFVCICVLNYCHRAATQLQLNISYRIISYHISYHISYIISYHKMQATRSFDMWTVFQWPRATCQEIVILDNAAMETSKLKCGILLILYNAIKCTFHLSSHHLNISCWSPYNNSATNVIFLAQYFTVISKHRTYREFSPVSNKNFFLTLTEVFPCLFLSSKANARCKTRKDGARPALFHISCYLCCSVVICVVLYIVCV
jgi:hypothetical protein